MREPPLWVHILGLVYIATGVFRLVCHWPQARQCLDAPEYAQGVSLATWCGLLVCASVAFLYAVLVVRNWPLIVSTACNVAGPVLVIVSVLLTRQSGATRRRRRAGLRASRRSRAP